MKFSTLVLFSLREIFLFFLDKLRKRYHKFTYILQLSQSREQDFHNSNKFLHLIGPIIEQR